MRILIGGMVAAVLAAVVVGVFTLGGGGVSLASAAESMQGKSLGATVTTSMKIEGQTVTLKGPMLQSADLKRIHMVMDGELQGTDIGQTIVVIGEDTWVGGEALTALLPKGKRWVHTADAGLAELNALSFEELIALVGNATDIEDRGETEIDGKTVTHYAGTVDLEQAAKDGGLKPDAFGKGVKLMPIEVWLDEAERPVRMKTGMTVEGQKIEMTMDDLEFDVATDSIKAPPKGETVEDSEVGIFSQS